MPEPHEIIADRFEVERLARSGGMGNVYRARDRQSGDTVALKILRDTRASNAERFIREARVLADLKHPGIVRYITHGQMPGGSLYLAMEWLEGEDLADRLGRGELTFAESATVMRRVAEALGAAHAQGVVHRDIKPRNLFLTGGDLDRPKVLDFGIARLREGTQETRPGTSLGTPGYMAPEQARGEGSVDARTDVFALGCVLFECLTGRPAFTGEHELALLAKILLEDPPRVSEIRRDAPPALDKLVQRMLAKDIEERIGSCAEVVAELDALTQEELSGSRGTGVGWRQASLTASEQRLLCVVALGRVAPVADATTPTVTMPISPQRTALANAVKQHGGALVTLADGSVVATLLGRGTATDQASHAARCALAMRKTVPDAPMALATGRGMLAEKFPVGEVIDRAARLLDDRPTSKGAIRVDDVTGGLLGADFDLRGDETGLELRGVREIAAGARTLLGQTTPCVGREAELATFDATYQACVLVPVARALVVSGLPGMGKSRLRHEFVRTLREVDRTARIMVGRGDSISQGSPFMMLARALRRELGLLDGEHVELQRKKVRAKVGLHFQGSDLLRVSEFLGEMLQVPFPDDRSVQLRAARRDALIMGDQMRRAWEDWMFAQTQERPVILILEDLQWGDLPSVQFVDAALRHLHDRPFFVLALGRPEIHDLFPRLWEERGVQEIRLGELSKKAGEKLVKAVLGDKIAPDAAEKLVARAGGNAFCLEELIRAAASDGAGKSDELPGTVVAVSQARLERLEAEARRVLRAASVFGTTFWPGGVAALMGGESKRAEVNDWLNALSGMELVKRRGEGRLQGEVELTFRHALVRDAAYAMLTESDRVLGHRLAGAWLEQAGEKDAMVLAEHAERGAEAARAIHFYLRAAENALEGGDLEAVLRRCERGITLGAGGEALGGLRLLEAKAHRWRAEQSQAETRGLEAMRCLPRGSARWFDAAGEVAIASGLLGRQDHLVDLCEDLLGMQGGDVSGAQVIAWARAATFAYLHGQNELAQSIMKRIEALEAQVKADPDVMGRIHYVQATKALCSGDTGAYLVLSEAAATDFEQAGNLRSLCVQRQHIGNAYLQIGGHLHAERSLRAALGLAERTGNHSLTAETRHWLSWALAGQGALEKAIAMGEQAVQTALALGSPRLEARSRSYLAAALALAGDLDRAELESHLAADASSDVPPVRAHALAVLAQALLLRKKPEPALEHASEAMRILESMGGIEEGESLVRLVHAEALAAVGRMEEARASILRAHERLQERAAKISDGRMRQSFLANVGENARTVKRAKEWGTA